MTEMQNTSTPNILRQRDPELLKSLATFRSRVGDILLSTLTQPAFRSGESADLLADLHAAAQVLRVLAKDTWTEEDLNSFDDYWRDASRSDFFADEFEADRHRIQACIEEARQKLLEEPTTEKPRIKQRTLW